MNTALFASSPESMIKICGLLRSGEIVALPTETVYGLAGNAFSPTAVLKIFRAKERPSFDPLIVHVSEKFLKAPEGPIRSLIQQNIVHPDVLKWMSVDEIDSAMKKFWPGPLTFILPRGKMIPDEVTSGQTTVGIRMPAHPLFQAILNNIDFPLAAPSANRFGRISPTDAHHVLAELDGKISGILNGGSCTVGVESTIIKIESPLKITLLRPGKIGRQEIEAHFNVKVQTSSGLVEKTQAQIAPGMLDEHYAPSKPLILIPFSFNNRTASIEALSSFTQSEGDSYLAMNRVPDFIRERKHASFHTLSAQNSLKEMAHALFATLRELDADPRIKTIYCDLPEDLTSGLGQAIRDRLLRASRNKPE